MNREKMMQRVTNKRGVLQVLASVFDPLGKWEPYTIWARLLFQEAVRAVKGWDDSDTLPEDLLDRFGGWQKSGADMERMRIRRWTATRETQDAEPELHVFSDASAKAYGVAAYRRMATRDGAVHVSLVFSKARVVPIKVANAGHHESIPRLELQAARLAAQTRAFIQRESGEYKCFFHWVD